MRTNEDGGWVARGRAVPGAVDARHDHFAAPMFRVKNRRSRRRRTYLRATPTTFGIVGRLLGTAVIVGPPLFVVALMARAPQDANGGFNAFFFVVVPASLAIVLLLVPPLWRPGRRQKRQGSVATLFSRRGTPRWSSESGPR